MDADHIRQYNIRTMPDWALAERNLGAGMADRQLNWAHVWAEQNGIAPPPTHAELETERQRRSDLEVLNRLNLAAELASMPDLYFIPSRDGRALQSLVGWLWGKDERRMTMTIQDLDNERIRRGLPRWL